MTVDELVDAGMAKISAEMNASLAASHSMEDRLMAALRALLRHIHETAQGVEPEPEGVCPRVGDPPSEPYAAEFGQDLGSGAASRVLPSSQNRGSGGRFENGRMYDPVATGGRFETGRTADPVATPPAPEPTADA